MLSVLNRYERDNSLYNNVPIQRRGCDMRRGVILLLVVAVSLVAACGPQIGSSQPSSVDQGSPNGPIRIGVLTPLSPPGDVSAGQLIQRGAELGAKYVNEVMGGVLGGRPVEIVVEDDQGTPEQGVAGYRRLAVEKKVVAVIGQFHSSVNLAVNEIAKDIGVPVLSTQGSAKDITALHYDIAFRSHVIDPVRVKAWLEFIKKQGYKRIALIAEDTDYGIGISEEFKQQAQQQNLGLEILDLVFDRRTTDLTPQLLQVKAFNPDLVINIAVGEPTHLVIDQAYTIDLFPEVPMLTSYDFPIRPEYWELHATNGDQLMFTAYFHPKQELSELGKWMQKEYEAKYKEPPIYTSLNAFGQVVVLAQAINNAGTTEPGALIKALEQGTFEGWAGPVTFPRAEGPFWHTWTPPVLILQYTQPTQDWREAEILFEYKHQ